MDEKTVEKNARGLATAVDRLNSAFEILSRSLVEYTEGDPSIPHDSWEAAVDLLNEIEGRGLGVRGDMAYVRERLSSFLTKFGIEEK